MGIARIQSRGARLSGSSGTITLNALPTGGNTLVICMWGVFSGGSATFSVSDNQTGSPNTYTKLTSAQVTNSVYVAIYYALNVTVNLGTFTITVGGSGSLSDGCAAEFSGVKNSGQPQSAALTLTGTTSGAASPGTITPSAADTLVVGAVVTDYKSNNTTMVYTNLSFPLWLENNGYSTFTVGMFAFSILQVTSPIEVFFGFNAANWGSIAGALTPATVTAYRPFGPNVISSHPSLALWE
jgi:hypothetical protein